MPIVLQWVPLSSAAIQLGKLCSDPQSQNVARLLWLAIADGQIRVRGRRHDDGGIVLASLELDPFIFEGTLDPELVYSWVMQSIGILSGQFYTDIRVKWADVKKAFSISAGELIVKPSKSAIEPSSDKALAGLSEAPKDPVRWRISRLQSSAFIDGRPCSFSTKEFRLLCLLAERAKANERLVSLADIGEEVWGDDFYDLDDKTPEADLVRRLRDKLLKQTGDAEAGDLIDVRRPSLGYELLLAPHEIHFDD
jgi:hypothetical protein